jgi:hypothetical protein
MHAPAPLRHLTPQTFLRLARGERAGALPAAQRAARARAAAAVAPRALASSAAAPLPLSPTGLFAVPFLPKPEGFARAAAAALAVCRPLVAAVSAVGGGGEASAPAAPPAAAAAALLHEPRDALRLLRDLDAISDALCKVLDAAECARNVAADARWRDAADAA